jgi:hypothetical protein
VPVVVSPTDAADLVPISTSLSWQGTDADLPPRFDVYFGQTSASMTLLAQAISNTSVSPNVLKFGTTYFWQVVSFEGGDTVKGPVWSFTTETYDPALQVIDTGATFLKLQWNAAPPTSFVHFEITLGGSKTAVYTIDNAAVTNYTIDSLLPKSSYVVSVTAVYSGGVYVESRRLDVSTKPPVWAALAGTDQLVYYLAAPGFPPSLSMDVNANGVPFLAYPQGEAGTSMGRAVVQRYVGGAWQPVGQTSIGSTYGYYVNLALALNGNILVAHSYAAQSGSPVQVESFNGTSWQSLSMVSIPDSAFVTYAAPQDHIPLAINKATNQPTLATNGLLMRRFNGASWDANGDMSSAPIPANCTGIDMAMSKDNHEYVCYADQISGCHVIFTHPNTPDYISDLVDSPTDFPDMDLAYPCLDIECDQFGGSFVAYRTTGATGSVCKVKQYKISNAFELVGTQVSDGPADQITMAIEAGSGVPYVAYEDELGRCIVKKLVGGSWVTLGDPAAFVADPKSNIQLKVITKPGEYYPTVYLAFLSESGMYQVNAYSILDM